MAVNKLKALITIFIVIVSFNLKSQFVKETCATEVQVIGFDTSKCGACWGFMITFEGTPEGEYLLADPNEHFKKLGIVLKDNRNLSYPIKLKIDFEKPETGWGNRIVISCAKIDE